VLTLHYLTPFTSQNTVGILYFTPAPHTVTTRTSQYVCRRASHCTPGIFRSQSSEAWPREGRRWAARSSPPATHVLSNTLGTSRHCLSLDCWSRCDDCASTMLQQMRTAFDGAQVTLNSDDNIAPDPTKHYAIRVILLLVRERHRDHF
jgi:hypothetical protein